MCVWAINNNKKNNRRQNFLIKSQAFFAIFDLKLLIETPNTQLLTPNSQHSRAGF